MYLQGEPAAASKSISWAEKLNANRVPSSSNSCDVLTLLAYNAWPSCWRNYIRDTKQKAPPEAAINLGSHLLPCRRTCWEWSALALPITHAGLPHEPGVRKLLFSRCIGSKWPALVAGTTKGMLCVRSSGLLVPLTVGSWWFQIVQEQSTARTEWGLTNLGACSASAKTEPGNGRQQREEARWQPWRLTPWATRGGEGCL